jgi:hypothetical protein
MAGKDLESPANLMRWVPITLLMRSGTLQRRGDRITFTLRNQVWDTHPYLDAPVAEMHSVAVTLMGLTIWHGKRRYRFTFVSPPTMPLSQGSTQGYQSAVIETDLLAMALNNSASGAWASNLEKDVGSPPPGLRVPKPWSMGKCLAFIGVMFVVFLAVAAGIVLLTGG